MVGRVVIGIRVWVVEGGAVVVWGDGSPDFRRQNYRASSFEMLQTGRLLWFERLHSRYSCGKTISGG